jgi:plasmid stability protein
MIAMITMKSIAIRWGFIMASLTIRNLEDSLKADLRLRAARHGLSMEEEARQILRQALASAAPSGSLARRIHDRFAGLGAESLPIPARKPSRPAPRLD